MLRHAAVPSPDLQIIKVCQPEAACVGPKHGYLLNRVGAEHQVRELRQASQRCRGHGREVQLTRTQPSFER